MVKITAHRGSSGTAPENTAVAIEEAIRSGAEYVEIDVQETLDGRIVLLHDEDLKRTTGFKKNIRETNFSELADLEAGAWFDEKFRGEKIPLLEDIIELCRGRILLNIELKFNGSQQQLAERVAALVINAKVEDSVVITSFELPLIDRIKKIVPAVKTGLIFYFMPSFDVMTMPHPLLSVHKRNVTKRFLKKARSHNKEVHVWTVNDPEDMNQLLELNVDNIITNFPAMLNGMRKEKLNGERI